MGGMLNRLDGSSLFVNFCTFKRRKSTAEDAEARRGRFLGKMIDLQSCSNFLEFRVKDRPLALSLRVLCG
jgi:hypothetical protein